MIFISRLWLWLPIAAVSVFFDAIATNLADLLTNPAVLPKNWIWILTATVVSYALSILSFYFLLVRARIDGFSLAAPNTFWAAGIIVFVPMLKMVLTRQPIRPELWFFIAVAAVGVAGVMFYSSAGH